MGFFRFRVWGFKILGIFGVLGLGLGFSVSRVEGLGVLGFVFFLGLGFVWG